MFGARNQMLRVVSRQGRIAACVVLSIALGILNLGWITEREPRSRVSAAEQPKDAAAVPAQEEASEPSRSKGAAGSTTFDAPPIEYFPKPSKHEIKIREALDLPTSIEFLDLPLVDCMAYLTQYHKINIWFDRKTLTEEGVRLDQPITLKLAGVTLRSILKLLLEPVQLTYVIEDDVMKISTPAGVGHKVITRTYPVRDLYRGPIREEGQPVDEKGAPRRAPLAPRPGDLETAITKAIEPDSWEHADGPGSITYVSEAGSFVIRQTTAAHEQILQLLRDLRDAKRAGQGAANEPAAPRAGWKLRGPKRAESYSVVGIIDLDGDDKSDAGRFHDLIRAIGASIDNEVDEQGVLRIDGALSDDGRVFISEKTKFVVVGKIPQPADLADANEIATSLKIGGLYKDLEDQARDRGVRIVSLKDFLRYIGYERVDKSTE